MRFLDFFAGVGGFRRGMELAGHECVGFCEWDKFATASYISMHLITEEQKQHLSALDLKKRQKEILKDEYRNGEWYSNDICNVDAGSVPRADCWCFGAPCQDFSVAGKRAGLDGDRSSLVRQVFRILGGLHEEDRPEWLIYENVKGMLSSNKGFDFLAILLEMDELGYDIEWQLFNSKDWGVPQNRERVYTVGHLRSRGERKIFPVTGTDRENSVPISIMGHRDGYKRNTQVFSPDGITEALSTAAGGGRGHHAGINVIGLINGEKDTFGEDRNRVCLPICNTNPSGNGMNGNVYHSAGFNPALTTNKGEGNKVAIPIRYGSQDIVKEENDTSCNPGIMVQMKDFAVYAVWYEKYQCYIAIRKLTPKECFRLQGWTDDYFEKAQFVNSDSQLYKQAGNGVTVNVVYEIAKRMSV